ncbi:Ig-like, group 1 [Shewanella denitrificans OS217]|uniref:Ig-like, group 1 n=1 Tax=Shewanella denitrificans (strain OS217 / ATCC BAA-1090 / DSM 15013) TaxID=318161 RepID=Q12LR6_SHEDO|nr:hypothetical protein [Shewanella denitrificans]ABE55610.1 Ig-like, group 1 [Shewanella denitrificans OS217]
MKSAYNVYLALLFSLLMSACGGGGSITDSGDGGNVTPPVTSVVLSSNIADVTATTPATITATVSHSVNGPISGEFITFSLKDPLSGTFDPVSGTARTNAQGIATIKLSTADKAGASLVTAALESGEFGTVAVSMKGDGGQAAGGAQVDLVLTDAAGQAIQSITTLTPGKLTATVSGLTKPAIVTFASPIGDLPIKTAVTNAQGKASVDIYAGSSLGAGEVTASLSTGEIGKAIVVVGATNVVMGSGSPFVSGKAAVSVVDLTAGGTATISVLIQDDKGNPYTQPVDVNFSSTCATKSPAQATISSPVSSVNGVATTTYLAQGCVGADQINVTANAGGINLSASGSLNVLQASVGSIVFISAQPQNISILGTGGTESSVVKFKVLDKNSNVVSNQSVSFSLNTTVGGISLDPVVATTNSEGIVQTVVRTGTVATSVRVTGTVDGSSPLISSQSSQLIVSTGIPDQDSFSLSAEFLNAEGWEQENTVVKVTARLADAFNNPVPNGTTVSFTTEGGAIQDACQTVNGACSVNWTSQQPRPEGEVIIDGTGAMIRNPSAVLSYDASVGRYGNIYGQRYGGRATITATAIGEESFPDLNGNGRFDASELNAFLTEKDVSGRPFDLADAFTDYNEDGLFNPQQTGGQIGGNLEELVDFNTNGVFDAADSKYNGVLCAQTAHAGCADGVSDSQSLYVRASLVMVMSGSTAYATKGSDILIYDHTGIHSGGNITILGKGAASVLFTISDLHNQQMPAGSKVRFKTSAGSVVSSPELIWPSSNYNGGREFSATLKGEDEPNSGVFIVEVEAPNGLVTQVVSIAVSII